MFSDALRLHNIRHQKDKNNEAQCGSHILSIERVWYIYV